MLSKYMEIEYVKNMFNIIDDYNVNMRIDKEIVDATINRFLTKTMLFISVYGTNDIRDKIVYCINFIIDNCLNFIENNTKEQLYELIIAIGAFPLISKILPLTIISENYINYLKTNVRNYGKYYYTDKQLNLYSKIYSNDNDIIFSAPTSYGKTHLSVMTILDMMKSSVIKNALIIVPTKALINDYRKTINKLADGIDVNVFESPYIHPDYSKNNIFVYTQERTLVAIDYADLCKNVNIVLIDESQSLADTLNDRTLLLVKCINYFQNVTKIYLTPFVKDIYRNVISNVINSSKEQFSMELNSNDSIVSNNKYIVDISNCEKIVWYNATFAKNDSELIKIKEYETKKLAIFDDSYTLAIDIILDVYNNFVNSDDKSIIYIASKDESMKVALQIYNRLEDKDVEPPARVKALIEHLKNNIHEKFLMLNFIDRGIAYHNSCLDSYTKRQLEYIMGNTDDNFIDKLVCTNTIDSGVNLGAKNIFVLIKRNMQGKHTEIKYANLLGRAARLGNNTQGNLFYIKMNDKHSKYETEFYKSNEVKDIIPTKVNVKDLKKEDNVTYRSFLEDKEIFNVQKEKFLSDNKFVFDSDTNYITNGEINLTPRVSNGLDYYIDTHTILESEVKIKELSADVINKYLNCLGNYEETKEFISFLHYCYNWDETAHSKVRNRLKDINFISTIITFLVQGRSIKEIVNDRIKKMDRGDYNLYVDTERNYVKTVSIHSVNNDLKYVLFNKNNLEHINTLVINSLDQTQNLIEFHVKNYIRDFYYRVRKIHGNSFESSNFGNFLEFSAIDDNKIILIENGIVDSFALTEFSKPEYKQFYNNRKVILTDLLDYVEKKFSISSPYYYAVKDIM